MAEIYTVDRIGTVLFRNIFKMSPESLKLFPFKDEENMYKSESFI